MKAKLLVASVVLALSGSAFGWSEFAGTAYRGAGTWSTPRGDSGRYTVNSQVVAGSSAGGVDFYHVVATYNGASSSWDVPYTYAYNARTGYFDVLAGRDGPRIGGGYCVQGPVCHYSVTYQGAIIEQTFSLVNGRLMKMGSKVNTDHSRVLSWQETFSAE